MQCPRCLQDNPSHATFCLVSDLQRALGEALEEPAATSEILRVISQSPTDAQGVRCR